MAEYRAPVRDALFALRHIGGIEELTKTDRYAHADPDSITAVVEELGRFMSEVFAPTNAVGDREGLTWSPEGVTTPEVFKDAWQKYVDAGWQGLNAEVDYGGACFPEAIELTKIEFTTAANAALSMMPGLTTGAIECLQAWASEELKERFLPRMITGEWSGTMNLTEPQAGSDVGQASTRAVPQPDGTYRLTGTKIFISFGEHDLAENVVHLVLARTPDAPPGTKGISLFLVPKHLVEDDGSLGRRNDVRCVSIEHKMGIHASPTCVMSYGDDDGAVGYLIGEEHQGMRAMFTMMNSARLAVGVQGLAMGDAAYQKALDYARERRQGREIGSSDRGPAPIEVHPDVRRMLLDMRSHLEAMRNLIVYNAVAIDYTRALDAGDEVEHWQEIADLLTPVTKAWCTDLGVDITSTAVQVFGGMGYIEESGVAQHFRDMRIAPIYEGTNGIQGMDLVGRKLPLRGGAVVVEFLAQMRALDAELEAAGGELAELRAQLAAAIDALESATEWIMAHGVEDPRDALAGATPYLRMFGTTVGGWLMARQALAARHELDAGDDDTDYLSAKVATARYYGAHHLTRVAALLPSVTAGADLLYAVDADQLASL